MRVVIAALLMSSALIAPGHVFAQSPPTNPPAADDGGLEVVIVTAQKRAEGLADVPISISAVSGRALEALGQSNLEQVSSSIPNLKITQTAIANRIAIRGIASGDNKGFEQSVAMFVDGIYYGRDQLSRMPLVDMQRIEVLRGPQPTLFGKNAIAGAVNVVSRRPTADFEGYVNGLYEFEHQEAKLTAVVSGPLTDKIGGRLVANYRTMDGYFTNTRQNRKEPNVEESFVRGILEYNVGGSFSADLKIERAEFTVKGQPREIFNPVGSYNAIFSGGLFVDTNLDYIRADGGYESRNEIFNAVLNANLELGTHTLTSVTGYLDYNVDELIDVDFVAPSFLDGTKLAEEYQQFSQELRLTSPGNAKFNYITGIYYQNTTLDATDQTRFNATFLGFGPPFNAIGDTSNDRVYAQKSELISVFAQADYALTEQLKVTLGGRFNSETKSGSRILSIVRGPLNTFNPAVVTGTFRALNIEAHSITGDLSEDSFNPMANIQYDFDNRLMVYASYARGTKAGGFDIRSNSLPTSTTVARPGAFQFAEESAENFEAGLKYNTRRLSVNFSVYNTTYTDLQTNVFDGTLSFNVQNASGAQTQGFESDFRWKPDRHFTLSGAIAYLDFEFTDFPKGQCYYQQVSDVAGGFCSYTGKRNALTPEWSGNLAGDFTHNITDKLKFGANLSFDFSSGYIAAANLDPRTDQDQYVKIGARLAIGRIDEGWTLALVGRNITSERIIQTAGAAPLATTITRGTGIAYNGIFDRPASVALTFDVKF